MRKYLGEKRKVKREEKEKERNLKKEKEIWKFINRKRKKRDWRKNNIKKEEWRKYFMELLERREITRINTGNIEKAEEIVETGQDEIEEEANENQEEVNTEELGTDEIGKAVIKMKLNKVAGIDGIQMEAWKYEGEEIKKGLKKLLKRIWKEEHISEDWKSNIIVPLYKRGDQEKVGNYRGISLLCSAYKIYAEILRNRLEEEVEEKEVIPIRQVLGKESSHWITFLF